MTSEQIQGGVLVEAIQRDRLIGLMEEALSQRYPIGTRQQSSNDRGQANEHTKSLRKAQIRYNAVNASIIAFGKFLADSNITAVDVEEDLFQQYSDWLSKHGARSYRGNHMTQTRDLINSLPPQMRRRELMTLAEVKRAHRWDEFSENTPIILNDFFKNGRKLKRRTSRQAPELTSVPLSQDYREQIVKETLTVMRAIQARDILVITPDDIQEFIEIYEEDGKKNTALSILDYIRPLFTNLLAKGTIKADPLLGVERKTRCENLDYVQQQGIDLLADLGTLDMNDFMDVRNRLIAFTLNYDFALRNREGALIKTPYLQIEEIITIDLPKEIQKIKWMDSRLFCNFPEVSRILLERYLELRKRKNPTTDILIISETGQPLGHEGCRSAVKQHCEKLGIKTRKGKTPTPHRLRHSFGTLNTGSLGLCLDITEVQKHYRHADISTTQRLYLANNNTLNTMAYKARMKVNGNANSGLHQARNDFNTVVPIAGTTQTASLPSVIYIPEGEAIRQVRDLKLNYLAVRQCGLAGGKVRKNGRGYEYSAPFITDIANNYFSTQEAMDLLAMPKSSFFFWKNSNGIECLQIGQVGLYRKDTILRKKRAG